MAIAPTARWRGRRDPSDDSDDHQERKYLLTVRERSGLSHRRALTFSHCLHPSGILSMTLRTLTSIALAAGLLAAGAAFAQQQPAPAAPAAPPNLDAVPEKMRLATPYGAPTAFFRER